MSAYEQSAIGEIVQDAFERMRTARKVTKKDLTILGGEFKAERLSEFLRLFGAIGAESIPWVMVETIDRFVVYKNTGEPSLLKEEDPFFIERVRIFGPAADLDIRRDGDIFRWRYLADTNLLPSEFGTNFPSENFWDANPDAFFYALEERYLQWWINEQRVAQWTEPAELERETRWLQQVLYLNNGQVVFSRYLTFTK